MVTVNVHARVEPGARVGPYEIVDRLGAGGMGEVWRARDTRLDRSVAIKMLPAAFADNAQLRLRFEREARTISKLSHPNICTLYDVGEGYLVMELLDGESLAQRLVRGPLPLDEVLRYGAQIADALDRAHREGVVHRDVKPGNVVITKKGAKLLDFGLARSSGAIMIDADAVTVQRETITETGTIVGTFQYMAPEQLDGADADARTDIFALGALLYEMTTGKRAFDGASKPSVIAAIMAANPTPVAELQPLTPPALEQIIRTCLQRDPDLRWQSAHDVAEQLRWISQAGVRSGIVPAPGARRRARAIARWAVLALGAILAVFGGYALTRGRHAPPKAIHLTLPGMAAEWGTTLFPRVSPDGRSILFTGREGAWIWSLETGTARLAHKGGTYFLWLPDGKKISFLAKGGLMKADLAGGPDELIVPGMAADQGGDWSARGGLIFSDPANEGVHVAGVTGGATREVTKLDASAGEIAHTWPTWLPDARHFLFVAVSARDSAARYRLFAGDVHTGTTSYVTDLGSASIGYSSGWVFAVRDRNLQAIPFDPETMKTTGEAVTIAPNVGYAGNGVIRITEFGAVTTIALNAFGNFSVSEDVLAYADLNFFNRLDLIDAKGNVEAVEAPPGTEACAFSPDGARAILEVVDPATGASDLWMYDLNRKTALRLTTTAQASESSPVWFPDGKRIAYARTPFAGERRTLVKWLDGSQEDQIVEGFDARPRSVTPDGAFLIGNRAGKIIAHPLGGGVPITIRTPGRASGGAVSRDGRWIGYTSSESGAPQVFVQGFPRGPHFQISTDGGGGPKWKTGGGMLMWIAVDGAIMGADVRDGFENVAPRVLFRPPCGIGVEGVTELSPLGDRVLLPYRDPLTPFEPVHVLVNWQAALRERMEGGEGRK